MSKPKKDAISEMINVAVSNPDIPKIYANGFVTGIGNGDTLIILQQNSKPVAVLNFSFTVAKTLALKLGGVIKEVEDQADTIILTTDDFSAALSMKKKDDEGKNADS